MTTTSSCLVSSHVEGGWWSVVPWEEEGWSVPQTAVQGGWWCVGDCVAAFVTLFILVTCIKHQIKQIEANPPSLWLLSLGGRQWRGGTSEMQQQRVTW